MRVAVHHPVATDADGAEAPGSVFAYKWGRITDHVDVLTGETTPAAKVAELFKVQAEAEYPACEVTIERLIDSGDGTSQWVREDKVSADSASPEGRVVAAPELAIEQSQQMPSDAEQAVGGV